MSYSRCILTQQLLCSLQKHQIVSGRLTSPVFSPQGFVIELLLTLESGIDTLADTVKNYDLLSALAQ